LSLAITKIPATANHLLPVPKTRLIQSSNKGISAYMKKFPTILLLIETSRGYGRGLLRGIAKYSSLHGPWDMECGVPFYIKPDKKTARRAKFQMQHADGI
jgi:hypothetical protein